MKFWRLEIPKIVISVITDMTGTVGSNWSQDKQESFIKGLVKASNATSMWIITKGLNAGFTKLIGELFQEDYEKRFAESCFGRQTSKSGVKKTPLIGLCHVNMLTYHEEFDNPRELIPVENLGNKPEENLFDLSPFHSHFLIIKDKTYYKTESQRFLLKLTDAITCFMPTSPDQSFIKSDIQDEDPKNQIAFVPILAVLVQGDLQSVHYILSHLKRKLPVLIINGSGGLADVLAYTYYEVTRRDLQLTIDWNCPELASSQVFYKEPSFKVQFEMFEQTLLKDGREEFISLFLETGFKLHKFLDSSQLIKLFEHVLKEQFFRQVCWEKLLGYSRIVVLDENFIDWDLNWIVESLIGFPIFISSTELNDFARGIYRMDCPQGSAADMAERKALIVLIMWALISDRGKLALQLWQHIDQPVIMALVCCLILDRIQAYVVEQTKREQLEELKKEFSDMALGVFDAMYSDMPSNAYDSLSIKIPEWGHHSVIDMAAVAQNKEFVAHMCCQRWLTNTFMDKIKLRDYTWGFLTIPTYIKVMLCAFLIFPMYLWVRFKETTVHEFVGHEEVENDNLYYGPIENEEPSKRFMRRDSRQGRLLKYHYPSLRKMIYWMWSAPITKFWVSHIFYILYLAVFSLTVIWPSCGSTILDLIICIWTTSIAFDSIHRIWALKNAFPNTKMFGTNLEISYMILFVISYFILRISPMKVPYLGKVLGCIGLLWFFYRMIFIYLPISSTLGPLLYRVKYMVTIDFVNFMKLSVLIIIANAIAMQAILYPDYPLIPEMIRKTFHKALISFFLTPVGELKGTEPYCVPREEDPNDNSICRASNYIDPKCSSGIAFSPYVIVLQYMLLLKLILLPVLFALFSNTGAKVCAQSDVLWKFQRYNLVTKFSVSLRLPPPLNIFSLIGMIYNCISLICQKCCNFCCKKKWSAENLTAGSRTDYSPLIESNYWRQLAKDYYEKQTVVDTVAEYTETESEIIKNLVDEVHSNEDMMFRVRNQIAQLEADVSYTHAHLETLKYHERKEEESKISVALHSLSRDSPYPRTKVHRFPVPDKYVPWEVMWLHYDPPIYTQPISEFHPQAQSFVDEDLLKEESMENCSLHDYLWNMEGVDTLGVYRNRESWMTDKKGKPLIYKLDDNGLPRNPKGRTGLKGKGTLPRWGPNHNIFVVITRWLKQDSISTDESLITQDSIEFVKTWFVNRREVSLPGGFVYSESSYSTVQSAFKMDDQEDLWKTSDQMIEFFERHARSSNEVEVTEEDIKCEKIYRGYMDDQLNTDQAWKEVELWHIHYNKFTDLGNMFKANSSWSVLTEEAFIQLQDGQTILLQKAVDRLQLSNI